MSDDALSNAEVARRLRQRVGDTVVVRSARGTSKLHIPDSDADRDAEPLCSTLDHRHSKPTRESPLASWPPGYRPWCSWCAQEALDESIPEGELVHPGVAADGGESA